MDAWVKILNHGSAGRALRVLLAVLASAGLIACEAELEAAAQTRSAPPSSPGSPRFIAEQPTTTLCDNAVGRVLEVGPGKALAVPSAAAAAARSGDVIRIAAGDYRGDVAVWSADNLRICGSAGLARLHAQGQSAQGKGIWVITGANIAIDSVTFHGARVSDRNGAGIRAQHKRGDLKVVNCGFYDNENGILSSSGPVSITVERSEFARNSNGGEDGQTHNIYIGGIDLLMVSGSYFHETRYGHNFKSRAKVTLLENSYLMDGAEGASSYLADFPNGGRVLMRGNLLHKGPKAPNRVAISFGAEGLKHPENTLDMVHNTVVMTRPNSSFVRATSGTSSLRMVANLLASSGDAVLVAELPADRLVQTANVLAPAAEVPGADQVLSPRFWPSDDLLMRLLLSAPVDAGHRRDSPAPTRLRALAEPARLIGALQSAP